MEKRRWARIYGDGCIYSGPCLVHNIIVVSDSTGDLAVVYDGRDAGGGKVFCEVKNASKSTLPINLGEGVAFDSGIYIDANDEVVETTIVFTPQ